MAKTRGATVAEARKRATLVQISLPPDMARDIEAMAIKDCVPLATMIRTLVAQRLAQLKGAAD